MLERSLTLFFCLLLFGIGRMQDDVNPTISCYSGFENRTLLENNTIITVENESYQRIELQAHSDSFLHFRLDWFNQPTSFKDSYSKSYDNGTTVKVYYLKVIGSGQVTVLGIVRESQNTDFILNMQFEVAIADDSSGSVQSSSTTDSTPASSSTSTDIEATDNVEGSPSTTTHDVHAAASSNQTVTTDALIAVTVILVVLLVCVFVALGVAVCVIKRFKFKLKTEREKNQADTSQNELNV